MGLYTITKYSNIYDIGRIGIQGMQSLGNLPAPAVAAGTIGGTYLMNKNKTPDPMNNTHPLVSKLLEYGVPLATVMGLYYMGRGGFSPTSTMPFN